MSLSPQQIEPAIVHPRSPPTTVSIIAPNGLPTDSELANLLSKTYREVESLKRDLSTTRKRAERAERLVHSLTEILPESASPGGSSNGPPNPNDAVRLILQHDDRAYRAEVARDEAEARRRVLTESWMELDRYLAVVEHRAVDARAGFHRIVSEGGGQLILTNIPLPGQPSHPTGPFVPPSSHQHHPMMPPPSSIHQSSRHSLPQSRSSSMNLRGHHAFPSLPLPPPPNTVNPRVRPRTGSMDAVSAPAVKRSRGDSDRRSREERAMFSESVRLIFCFINTFPDTFPPFFWSLSLRIFLLFGMLYFLRAR